MGRIKNYFMRGHTTIYLLIALVNSSAIWFGLIPAVKDAFGRWEIFFMVFAPLYLASTVTFGYWDFRRGFYKGEQTVAMYYSPGWQSLFFLLARSNWDDVEALKMCAQWLGDSEKGKVVRQRLEELTQDGAAGFPRAPGGRNKP